MPLFRVLSVYPYSGSVGVGGGVTFASVGSAGTTPTPLKATSPPVLYYEGL